jgi:hypothetical protein
MTTPRFLHRKYSITATRKVHPGPELSDARALCAYLRVLYHKWEHEEWTCLFGRLWVSLSLIETENAKEAGKYALQPETSPASQQHG